MTVTRNTIVSDLAAETPATTRVFEKFKIDFCCQGAMPLSEACARAGADVEQVVTAIEEIITPQKSAKDWKIAPVRELVQYILDKHHVYTREELDALQTLSRKVATRHGDNHPETVKLASYVFELAQELVQHMYKEEAILFPYVNALDEAIATGEPRPTPFFGSAINPIRMMMAEHDLAVTMLADVRVLTKEFALPEDACLSYRALYRRLEDFEADLTEHIRLEDTYLFPRSLELEGMQVAS